MIGLLYLRESGAGRDLLHAPSRAADGGSLLGQLPHLLFHLARDDATTDRWAHAEAAYGEAVALAREFGQTTELGASLAGLAWLAPGRAGRRSAGASPPRRAQVAAGPRRAHGRGVGGVRAGRARPLARRRGCRGRPASRRWRTCSTTSGVGDPDLSPGPELVEALLRRGRAGRGPSSWTPPTGSGRSARASPGRWRGRRGSGALLAGDDDLDERFGEALRLHARTPDRFETARTRLVYGERLRRARRRVDARVHLRGGPGRPSTARCRAWSDVVAAELDATGLTRPASRTSGPVVDLTPRELQIALLLAEGRTTREAAAALFLSPKTVEYHLRHVYTKLGIASRAELARRLPEVAG